MWLVSGVDEEHRFPRWTDAVEFYRQMVGDWLAAGREADDPELARSLDDLAVGQSHQVGFATADGTEARFELVWEVVEVGMDHYTAC